MKRRSGRHFLQIPGPTNVPDRVQDHRAGDRVAILRHGCVGGGARQHVAPKFSGTASGIMNTCSAIAGFVSPIVFGWLIDLTGNWHLPFAGSIGLLLGAILSFWMHPERPLDAKAPGPTPATLAHA
jgi:nitrate/nitrite transporter NarK